MAIVWYSEKQAEEEFEETLSQWATTQGYQGCYSAQETRDAIEDTRSWASDSRTALSLLEFVERSPKKITVVGMRGGYQCFDSTAGRNRDMPTIFIDLQGRLTVNVRNPHNLHLDPNSCKGFAAELDNRVALLHEFGHAKQWIERPTMFDNKVWADGSGGFDARLEKKTFAADIREKAIAMRERRGKVEDNLERVGKLPYKKPDVFQSKSEFEAFTAPVWGVVVEVDNMARHEWPICRELGLPFRSNYRDINCASDSAPSLTSIIRRKVAEELARQKAKKEAKTLELLALKNSSALADECPKCGYKQKNKLLLRQHINSHT
jgi:hypothetical protein